MGRQGRVAAAGGGGPVGLRPAVAAPDASAGKGLLQPHGDQLLNQWHRQWLADTEVQRSC
jgi:hypothetical protein